MRIKKKYIKYGIIILIIIIGFFAYKKFYRPYYPAVYNEKPLFGNQSAEILIEEFSDFQCPACGSAQPVLKQILKDYKGKIKLRYYHFPLTRIHPNAFKAAQASECANDQERFWKYHDLLFKNQKRLSVRHLKKYAADLGLDAKKFNACLDSGAKEDSVRIDQREAEKRGVRGTPTFYINGKKLESRSYESFKNAIEQG